MARSISILALVLILTSSFIAQASQPKITHQLIAEKNQQIVSLLTKRDAHETINFFHSHISEDATFQISFQNGSMPIEQQKQSIIMDKKDYINSFIQGLHYVDQYDVTIEIKNIQINADGKTAMVEEIMTEEGVMLNSQDLLGPSISFLSKTTCHTLYSLNQNIVQSDNASCHTKTNKTHDI